MSILGSIISGIFGSPAKADEAPPAGQAAAATPAAPAPAAVDIAAKLDQLTKTSGEDDIDWRRSIVDLMKILKLDSSLTARKAFAKELHYTGDMHNSAEMNVWLHQQVMAKVAANGGKLPDGVLHG